MELGDKHYTYSLHQIITCIALKYSSVGLNKFTTQQKFMITVSDVFGWTATAGHLRVLWRHSILVAMIHYQGCTIYSLYIDITMSACAKVTSQDVQTHPTIFVA